MKIVACLSFYDESPHWLSYTAASAARFCDALVAVDGAYALYPDRPAPSSGPEAHEALARTCDATGMELLLHVPSVPWVGNEVEKRHRLMRFAVELAGENGWAFVIDADEVVMSSPSKGAVKAELAEADEGGFEVCLVSYGERQDLYDWQPVNDPEAFPEDKIIPVADGPTFSRSRTRRLFKCHPSLRVAGMHWNYEVQEGDEIRQLWQGMGQPAWDLSSVFMEHRHRFRPPRRRKAGEDYYIRRNSARIEKLPEYGMQKKGV